MAPSTPERRALAVKPWTASYVPALAVSAGESLMLHQEDTEYPDWVWCTNGDGLGGWLPEGILDRTGPNGRATEAFDTRELTVTVGEKLTCTTTRDGWTWCRSDDAQGWVPLHCLDIFPATAPASSGPA